MSESMQPHLMVTPSDVASYVLVPGDPKRVGLMAEHLTNPVKVAENRQFVTITGSYHGIRVTISSSGIGVPAMLILVEELSRAGATTFIRVGTTGGLQQGVNIGDVVVATGAVRTDGGTLAYAPVGFPALAEHNVVGALVSACKKKKQRFHVGPVWTSEAYYAEGTEVARLWERLRVISVEMECSGLFVLSSIKGLASGAIMVVDGNLLYGKKKGELKQGEPAYDSRVIHGIHGATESALMAIETLDSAERNTP